MSAALITPDLIAQHQLTPQEYEKIVALLGREPSYTELGIFSVMWSEHCSYKSSRLHLKKLPTSGNRVVQGPGENAGVIDIGEGYVSPSRSNPTTTRVSSSLSRVRPPAWVGFCATFLPWAPDRLPSSIRCASAGWMIR